MKIKQPKKINVEDVVVLLERQANVDRRAILSRFFKTGKGEYGEGDIFMGVSVPHMRVIAREVAPHLSFAHVKYLLQNPIHEYRFVGLMVLCLWFAQSKTDIDRIKVYDFYISNREWVNNWDLVDSSAPLIVGKWLLNHDRSILYDLVESSSVWDRRMAVISTLAFIRSGEYADTLHIARKLMGDKHDLIHKAVGWMLREIGKKDIATLRVFLASHYKTMPRTTLRYAIERMGAKERSAYLKGLV